MEAANESVMVRHMYSEEESEDEEGRRKDLVAAEVNGSLLAASGAGSRSLGSQTGRAAYTVHRTAHMGSASSSTYTGSDLGCTHHCNAPAGLRPPIQERPQNAVSFRLHE